MGNRFSGRRRQHANTITTISTLDPSVLENSPPLFTSHPPKKTTSEHKEYDENGTPDDDDPEDEAMNHKSSVSTTTSTPSRNPQPQPPTANTPPLPPSQMIRSSSNNTSGDQTPELQGTRILIRSPTDPRVLLPVTSSDPNTLPEIIQKWTSENSHGSRTSSHRNGANSLQVLDDLSRSQSGPRDSYRIDGPSQTRTVHSSASSPVPVPNIFDMDDGNGPEFMPLKNRGRAASTNFKMKRSQSLGGSTGILSTALARGRSSSININRLLPKFRGRASTQLRKYPRFFESRLVDCPPQVYIHICSFLEVKSVCRMANVCRYLYIIGNNKELWRQLVRRDMNGYIRRKRRQQLESLNEPNDVPPPMYRNGFGAMTIAGVGGNLPIDPELKRAKSLPSLAWINRRDAYRVNQTKKEKMKKLKRRGTRADESPMSMPQSSPVSPDTPARQTRHGHQSKSADYDENDDEDEPPRRGFLQRWFSRSQKAKPVSFNQKTPPPPGLGNDDLSSSDRTPERSRQDQSEHTPDTNYERIGIDEEKSATFSEPKDSLRSRHDTNLTVPSQVNISSVLPMSHTRAHSCNDLQLSDGQENFLNAESFGGEYSAESSVGLEEDDDFDYFNTYIEEDHLEIDEDIDDEDLELEQRISRTPLQELDGKHPREVYKILQIEINNKKKLKEARKQREHLINSLRMAGLY